MKKLRPHEVDAGRKNIGHIAPTEEDYQQLEDAMYDMLEGVCETDEFGMPSYGTAMDNLIIWAQGSAKRRDGARWEAWCPLDADDVDDRLVAAESVWFDARLSVARERKKEQEATRADLEYAKRNTGAERIGGIKEVRSWASWQQ